MSEQGLAAREILGRGADIVEHPMLPGTWEVTWADDGNITIVLFGGHRAKEFAEEYVRYVRRNNG